MDDKIFEKLDAICFELNNLEELIDKKGIYQNGSLGRLKEVLSETVYNLILQEAKYAQDSIVDEGVNHTLRKIHIKLGVATSNERKA